MRFSRKNKAIAICVMLLLATTAVVGQAYAFRNFPIDNQHPDLRIIRMYKEPGGRIWIGSDHGLYSFDGNVCVRENLSDSLDENLATAFATDSSGRLWLASDKGEIWIKNRRFVQRFITEEGSIKKTITDLLFDHSGRLWIATAGEGLYVYEQGRLYNLNTDDGLSDNYCYAIEEGADHEIYCGTDMGLNICRFENKKKDIRLIGVKDGLPDYILRSISPVSKQQLVFGFQDNGAAYFQLSAKKILPFAPMPINTFGQFNDLYVVHGKCFISTEKEGLVLYENGSYTPLSGPGRSKNIFPDEEGNIWFDLDNRLYGFNAGLQFFKSSDPKQKCLYADSRQQLFMADESRQLLLKRGNSELLIPCVFTGKEVSRVQYDSSWGVVIGTYGKGLFQLDLKREGIQGIKPLAAQNILSIYVDNEQLIIGSIEGVYSLHRSPSGLVDVSPFLPNSSLGRSYVYDIYKDSHNRLWFATDGSGDFCFEKGKLTNYTEKEGISKVLYSITEDQNGLIWFTSYHQGIYSYDGKKFNNYGVEFGLIDDELLSISCDANNHLLLTGKNQMQLFDINAKNFYYFHKDNGLAEYQPELNAIHQTKEAIYICNGSDYIRYEPLPNIQAMPRVRFQGLRVFDREQDLNKAGDFKHEENNFTFSFEANCFSDAGRIRYQYLLEGYSKNWIITTDREVHFPNLPAGEYRFHVRASLNGNFSTAEDAIYIFKIRKALWQHWWFWLLIGIGGGAIIYLIARNRSLQLQKVEQLQKEKVLAEFEALKTQVSPHFLFNSLNTLIGVIEENPAKAVEYTEHLAAFYRHLLQYRNQELISLEEELNMVKQYLYIQQMRFGDALVYSIDIVESSNKFIPPLSLQMLAENAIKHNIVSAKSPLCIRIRAEKDHLEVCNNIQLKKQVEKSSGVGLQNINNRYRLLDAAKPEIIRDEKQFCVRLPLIIKPIA